MHIETKAQHEVTLANHVELFTTLDEEYSWVCNPKQVQPEILAPHKLKVVTECIHILESLNTTLCTWLQQIMLEETELQNKITMVEAAIWDRLNRLKDFLGVVEYSLTLWNHLQSPLELSSIHERVRVIETEVSQKKSILASLPLGESQVAMKTIM